MNRQVRTGQLIAPFGPGALYTDRQGIPLVVCGLDDWFKNFDQTQHGMVSCANLDEFNIFEPRLAELLHVDRLFKPADFRRIKQGAKAPPNALIYTPAQRFPCWYRNSQTHKLQRFNLHTERINPLQNGGGRWLPVRFVSVCANGHLCEFPWKQWIGCQCQGDGELYLTDRGGSELRSIRVECKSCPDGSPGRKGKSLTGTTAKPDEGEQSAFEKASIPCPGERPWLGENANEMGCDASLVGALINQTNLYFPKTISAILLPDLQQQDDTIIQLRNEIEKNAQECAIARTFWNMQMKRKAIVNVQDDLCLRGFNNDYSSVEKALESLFASASKITSNTPQPAVAENPLLEFRRAEFNIIRIEVNNPHKIPHLRVVPAEVHADLSTWFTKVNLVERLRETRVFYGFDRLEPSTEPLANMPESAMQQLFLNPPQQPLERWLPAIEVFGEGIYIEISEDQILHWQEQNADWLKSRLIDAFINRVTAIPQTLPPNNTADLRKWASKYLLIHSLSHILINQFVFDCGYGTAALRERLYVSVDTQAPMAGVLIYTAAGDSEGTLGGLVSLGRPKRLEPIVRRALSRAAWCSADPICSENLGGQGPRQSNLAACHACVLLPETSCETINHGLDRAMVIGTPAAREHGFMSSLLEQFEL